MPENKCLIILLFLNWSFSLLPFPSPYLLPLLQDSSHQKSLHPRDKRKLCVGAVDLGWKSLLGFGLGFLKDFPGGEEGIPCQEEWWTLMILSHPAPSGNTLIKLVHQAKCLIFIVVWVLKNQADFTSKMETYPWTELFWVAFHSAVDVSTQYLEWLQWAGDCQSKLPQVQEHSSTC